MSPGSDSGQYPTLSKAPITEALIDIRVQLPQNVDVENLRNIHDLVRHRFPKIESIMSAEWQIKIEPHGAQLASPPDNHPHGLILSSDVEPVKLQVRLDGFTFSRLKPYTNWTNVSADAKELWEGYKQIARPAKVTRLAVRYINRLELGAGRPFTDFILTQPELAPNLPQGIADYLMRLVIPNESGSIAVITQTTVPRPPMPETYPILFDIDVFRIVDLAPDAPEIWPIIMEELRTYKNQIFFGSLNPTFLETFK